MKTQHIFVTGKGGVGKSVVAYALAKNQAEQGKKTLLVELGAISFFKDFLGYEGIEHRPRRYEENLYVALWNGWSCLTEYTKHLVKVEKLQKLFMENQVSKSLIEVAPTLSEVAILGKVTSGVRRIGPPLNFDVIVVDGFATGHFIALLKAPIGMGQAINFGPMGEQCRSIVEVLRNPTLSDYVVVTNAEELPVIESLELADSIMGVVGSSPRFVLNRSLKKLKSETSYPLQQVFEPVLKHLNKAQNSESKAISRLLEKNYSFKEAPWILSLNPREILHGIMEDL
jgi:anion-transporting  ArsA/GET3 family ATPase